MSQSMNRNNKVWRKTCDERFAATVTPGALS